MVFPQEELDVVSVGDAVTVQSSEPRDGQDSTGFAAPGDPLPRWPREFDLPCFDGTSGQGALDFLDDLKSFGVAGGYTEREFMDKVVNTALAR